ncbi:MAG: CHRD domain-containing protein [Gammaproteobacteria bacterium]|nr:CHRD domain-containing protein [Gammaproteobacteria bacterium]
MNTERYMNRLSALAAASLALLLGPGTTAAEETSFDVSLSGGSGSGDSDGEGEGTVTVDSETHQISWELSHANIGEPTAMHIHQGAEGESGGVVVPMTVGTDPEGTLVGLTSAPPDVVEAILASPADYYVNIHNDEYPGGAIRGQLDD